MPWNPDIYNQFKNIRYKPFFDLVAMISEEHLLNAVDIGCGTGEQTKILSERFSKANFLGVDPSTEMLAKTNDLAGLSLKFQQSTVEEFIAGEKNDRKFDLVFSNAALQWSDDHYRLFPELISMLSEVGQIAIQMPVQKENTLNQLLMDLVQEKPFVDYLSGWKRESPLLSMDEYCEIFFRNNLFDIKAMQIVYPIIAESPQQLFDFISGSSLIPYMEKFTEVQRNEFIDEYKSRIYHAFKTFPAIYPFKRLLLYGTRQNNK